MRDLVSNKRTLFITTKNLDYIRNTQEIKILQNTSKSVNIIGSNAKSYLMRLIRVYSMLLFVSVKKYDLIFVGFAPQLIVPFFKRKFRNVYLIVDFFISVYDTFIFDRSIFPQNSIIAKLLKQVDIITISAADHIISDTRAHGDYFSKEFGVARGKITELYLQADKSIYYSRKIRRCNELIDKFIVLYFGSVLPLQGFDIVLKAVEQLKDHSDIYFYIIGPVKKQKRVLNNNIEYIEWLPQDELARYIAVSDLCLAGHFNAEIDKAKRTIPGKAYIYSSMGKRMILGNNMANHELYDDSHNDIYFVEMGSPDKLANMIKEVKNKYHCNDAVDA